MNLSLSPLPHYIWSILLVFLVVCSEWKHAEGKVVEFSKGIRTTRAQWLYIDKFCFDSNGGTFYITMDWGNDNQKILLYSDTEKEWPSVYSADNCEDRSSIARNVLTPNNTESGITRMFFVEGVRPRWWYVAIANCDPFIGEVGYLKLEFYNTGDKWHRQFSTDEQGLLAALIVFIALQTLLMVVFIRSYVTLKRKDLQTKVMVLLIASVAIELTTFVMQLLHYWVYSINGEGVLALMYAASLIDIPHQIIFISLILFMSKGWCISTMHISPRRFLTLILVLLTFAYVALFIWNAAAIDPASTLYIYESLPGYLIIAIRLVILVYFIWNIRISYIRERKNHLKKRFYLIFGICYSIWSIAMPITVLAAHYTNSWSRAKTVNCMVWSIDTVAYLGFAIMFRPFRANKFVAVLDPMVTFGNSMVIFPK